MFDKKKLVLALALQLFDYVISKNEADRLDPPHTLFAVVNNFH